MQHLDHRWYLVGFSTEQQKVRAFRVDRIQVALLEETFTPPAEFDVVEHLRTTLPFVRKTFAVEVWLGLPLAMVRQRKRTSPPAQRGRRPHPAAWRYGRSRSPAFFGSEARARSVSVALV